MDERSNRMYVVCEALSRLRSSWPDRQCSCRIRAGRPLCIGAGQQNRPCRAEERAVEISGFSWNAPKLFFHLLAKRKKLRAAKAESSMPYPHRRNVRYGITRKT